MCWGILVNTSQNPVNQQLAPLYVCLGSKRSHRLGEHGLDGGGEDLGSIFELGDGHGRAPDNDQVALRSLPSGRDPDIGVAGGLDKGIVANCNQSSRGHASLGVKVNGSSGVEKGDNETSPCRKP